MNFNYSNCELYYKHNFTKVTKTLTRKIWDWLRTGKSVKTQEGFPALFTGYDTVK